MPKSSVMRLEMSPEMSNWVAEGTSAVFDQATVGSDISSATQGSSVANVAGKNRAPTKQWAKASEKDSRKRGRPKRKRARVPRKAGHEELSVSGVATMAVARTGPRAVTRRAEDLEDLAIE